MNSAFDRPPSYRFGLFEANLETGELLKKGVRVKLQEQPFHLLQLLIENAGQIVSKDVVRTRLWPANTFVEFDASLSVAVGKLRDALDDDAENPRFIETVPRRGYRFIAPVERLARPDASSATPIVSAVLTPPAVANIANQKPVPVAPVTPSETASPRTVVSKPAISSRAFAIGFVIVLALLALAAYEFRPRSAQPANGYSSSSSNGTVEAAVPIRRSVAILGFRNLPGRPDEDWLSVALAEMLNTELAADGSVRMVSGEDVARAKRELTLSNEDTLARSTLKKLQSNPGADVVILGSYTTLPGKDGNRIRLDIRAQDTGAGETIAEQSVTGSEENLFELASQAGAAIRHSLGLRSATSEAAIEARASLPSNQRALQFYSEGLAKLRAFDDLEARRLLVQAVAADPQFPLAHSALSEAWWHQGYRVKAREEAKRAMDLSAHLPQEERLLIQGQFSRATGDWPKAVDAYSSLFSMFPDRLDYGLLLASAQTATSTEAALETLARVRKLPPSYGDDPRIDVTESSVYMNFDMAKAEAASKRAIAKATAQNSPVVVDWAYGLLCEESVSNGKSVAESLAICEKARQSAAAAQNPNGEAMMLTNLGAMHFLQGDNAQSEAMFESAIKIFRQIGNASGVATALSNIGSAKTNQGKLAEARKYFEESIPEYREAGDNSGVAVSLNNLGDLARQQGQLDLAESNYNQAQALSTKTADKYADAFVLSGLGDVRSDRGDFAGARKLYEQALALRAKASENQAAAETQVALAQLSIEEGKPAEAEPILRACQKQFHDERQDDDELTATIQLTRSLLAQGKIIDAKNELMLAAPLAQKNQNALIRSQFALTSAANSDNLEGARVALIHVLRSVQQFGYVGLEFETRLALGEIEKKAGHTAAARAEFSALEKDATARGFIRIARKAAASASA